MQKYWTHTPRTITLGQLGTKVGSLHQNESQPRVQIQCHIFFAQEYCELVTERPLYNRYAPQKKKKTTYIWTNILFYIIQITEFHPIHFIIHLKLLLAIYFVFCFKFTFSWVCMRKHFSPMNSHEINTLNKKKIHFRANATNRTEWIFQILNFWTERFYFIIRYFSQFLSYFVDFFFWKYKRL